MVSFSCELGSDDQRTQELKRHIKITPHFLLESRLYWFWINRPCL